MEKQNDVWDALAADLSGQKSTIIRLITHAIRLPIFAETNCAIQEIV